MSTVTLAAPLNGAGDITAERMRRLLIDRATARRAFDALVSYPRRAAAWVARTIAGIAQTRAVTFARDKGAWVASVAHTAGPVNLAVLTATTETGRGWFDTAARVAGRVLSLPLRMALAPLAFLTRHTGRPGRKVAGSAMLVAAWTRQKASDAYLTGVCWLSDHDSNPVVVAVRSWCKWSALKRLIVRFVPPGPWRIGAYTVAFLAVPTSGGYEQTAAALSAFSDRVQRAVGRLNSASGSDDVIETPKPAVGHADAIAMRALDESGHPTGTDEWVGADGSPDPKATVVKCRRTDGTAVTVRVHTIADGRTVYQVGRHLYVGRVPDGVDPASLADTVAAASDVAAGDGPPNRAAHRAAGGKGGRTTGRAAKRQ